MTSKITILERDEETDIILFDGEEIGRLTHDDLGWSGMETAKRIVLCLADRLGIEVVSKFEGEDE